ncbi:nitrogenase component 1 [Vallitalea guaymasensis]|uniref:nitrogenase component 1 n=1 Tax=Vallitalea guaymasensis TaxID=1185412 RepID=UPI002729AA1B|nr:nitrogenase component 1 [Vallitalea guaymasensis]
MKLYKNNPIASDRMGILWTLNGINDAVIIEFGPAGTTHFSIEGLMQFGADTSAKTFTTHMDEHDVTFGNEDRIIDAILEIDEIEKPEYIFVIGSSITSIIGIDLESVRFQVEDRVDSKIILLPDCDFQNDFTHGVDETLQILVNEITKKSPKMEKLPFYNILGLGIYNYNQSSDFKEIKRLMKENFSLELGTTFMLDTNIKDIEQASKALINIVLHKEGLEAAKLLEETYDQPYIYLTPYGIEGTKKWLNSISELLNMEITPTEDNSEINRVVYKENMLKRRVARLDNNKFCFNNNNISYKYLEEYLYELGFKKTVNEGEAIIRFSDGIEALHNQNVIQISHPSFRQDNEYPYLPIMGYRGAYYLVQQINNTLTKAELSQ